MKWNLVVICWFIGCCNVFAQYDDDSFNYVDEEEKDRTLSQENGSSARKAQIESIWSLSSSNFDWKMPERQGNNQWKAVSVPKQEVNIAIPQRKSIQNPSPVKARKNPQKVGSYNYATSSEGLKFQESRREQKEENARRAREAEIERKRKEKIKNLQDMQKGLERYYARTAKFHQEKAARDQWMATEGVRRLQENYHAIDMASVPQKQVVSPTVVTSGKDLAKLLEGEDEGLEEFGEITIVFKERDSERENKQGVGIDNSKYIDLYDEGGYNKDQLDMWYGALWSEDPFVKQVNEMQCTGYERIRLLEKDVIDLKVFNITTLPDMGCVILYGDSVVLLDNDSLPVLRWGIEEDISQVIACGTRTIGKQSQKIVGITENGVFTICYFDNEEFNIYPETDSTFLVCSHMLDLFMVTRFHANTFHYDEMLRTPSVIRKVVSNGTVTLVLTDDRIIDISHQPTLFYSGETTINDLCMTKEGMLFATNEKVVLLKSPEVSFVFADEGASNLWCDGSDIYLINTQGELIRYSKEIGE